MITTILKPLEILVRPLPPRSKGPVDAAGQPSTQAPTAATAVQQSADDGGQPASGSAAADQHMREAPAVSPSVSQI